METSMVLGGGGFIGSHLCKRLVELGHHVVAVDVEFPDYRRSQWTDCAKVTTDLRDSRNTNELLGGYNPNYLFQCAADMGGVEYFHSEHDWAAANDNALINAAVMAACAKRVVPPRILFTSTACAYATETQNTSQAMELPEEDMTWGTPDQLYGLEKRTAAFMYDAAPFDARVAVLHTIYGPMQEHAGIRMKFPSAVAQKARWSRKTGQLELLGDGTQLRTFLYIDDAVERIMKLMFDFDSSPGFMNIGSSQPVDCDFVARLVLSIAHGTAKHGVNVTHVNGPTGVRSRSCDNDKARKHFGELHYTSLSDGFSRFIDWLDKVDPDYAPK